MDFQQRFKGRTSCINRLGFIEQAKIQPVPVKIRFQGMHTLPADNDLQKIKNQENQGSKRTISIIIRSHSYKKYTCHNLFQARKDGELN